MSSRDGEALDLEALAVEVREWCAREDAAGWSARMAYVDDAGRAGLQRDWLRTLDRGGYSVPHWPRAWGGGRTLGEQVVIARELIGAGAPRLDLHFVALYHAAGTLKIAGTEEQKANYLPLIRDGQRWCQGFSEPEAGSDLASLRCRAERVDDNYRVNGHKIWSTAAAGAEMCLLLARTGPEGRAGISYFLLDLSTPGVTVAPIRNAAGDEEFCEILLEDVIIPASALVGAENEGWRIANATLGEERGLTMLERSEEMATGLGLLARLVSGLGDEEREEALELLGGFAERVESFRLLVSKVLDAAVEGSDVAAASILKLVYSELLQDITAAGVRLSGLNGHRVVPGWSGNWQTGRWFNDYVRSWEWTLGGGTNDVLRNVVGERVLGLPRPVSV